ncbi:CU044_5270 family protein [Kitasatospora sp. A2-31]|uniref:CU044_5270 family protein n=1 Tax=Kitasatospora sp. A2-31 TaxID=2916414 RepID=UPI001EEA5D93|nr:CU044_5270 family protein [Kitasatospora sp. A2-31]MCG6494468.1 CU044_5270 family protein [Kitasatospora sp. A2-31]
MNADLSQPHPVEREENEHFLPAVERELPAGRHEFHKERLMTRIHDDLRTAAPARPTRSTSPRRPFLRRPILLAVAACVLAGTIATGANLLGTQEETDRGAETVATGPVLTTRIGTVDPKGAAQLLDRISVAAAGTPAPAVRADQFIYVGSKSAGTHVRTVNGRSSLAGDELHLRQTWKSPDGTKGWLIEPGATGPEGVTLAGLTETGQKPTATLNAPTYDYLAALPTDPDALLQKIYTETRGQGRTPDQEAFTTIGDLLRESYPPAALTVALYKAAAKIPGVVMVDDAVDAAGRHGVAVARLDSTSGQRTEWIFDNTTLAFLGERTVQVEGSSGEQGLIKPGTVVFTHAVMTRAIVDRIKDTPALSS